MSVGETIRSSDVMTSSHSETAKLRPDDVYCESDADVRLISSDGVVFKVHSCYLKAASFVFRSMLEDCAQTDGAVEVRFTDDALERSKILRSLLDLACCKPMASLDKSDCFVTLDLINLVQKYDCITAIHVLKLLVSQPVLQTTNALFRFFWACALDDCELAHRFLPAAATRTWTTANTGQFLTGCIAGARALDLTAMSITWIDRLPGKYFLALLRASRLRADSDAAARGWDKVADDFKIQVEAYENQK